MIALKILPFRMGDHCKGGFGVLEVNGVINCAQVGFVVQQFAANREQQNNGVGFVLHGGKMQGGVLFKTKIKPNFTKTPASKIPHPCPPGQEDASARSGAVP
jgi:hypothetical protein